MRESMHVEKWTPVCRCGCMWCMYSTSHLPPSSNQVWFMFSDSHSSDSLSRYVGERNLTHIHRTHQHSPGRTVVSSVFSESGPQTCDCIITAAILDHPSFPLLWMGSGWKQAVHSQSHISAFICSTEEHEWWWAVTGGGFKDLPDQTHTLHTHVATYTCCDQAVRQTPVLIKCSGTSGIRVRYFRCTAAVVNKMPACEAVSGRNSRLIIQQQALVHTC